MTSPDDSQAVEAAAKALWRDREEENGLLRSWGVLDAQCEEHWFRRARAAIAALRSLGWTQSDRLYTSEWCLRECQKRCDLEQQLAAERAARNAAEAKIAIMMQTPQWLAAAERDAALAAKEKAEKDMKTSSAVINTAWLEHSIEKQRADAAEAEMKQFQDALKDIADGCCVCDGEDLCDRCRARAALAGVGERKGET